MKYKIVDPEQKNGKEELKKPAEDYGIIRPEWTLEEVVMPQAVRNELEDIVSFCKNKDKIVSDWGLDRFLKNKGGSVGINFFGHAGTGKTITAEGLAHAVNKGLIMADYSEITDSLLGGTEKRLSQLFEKAEKNNAIIFFDEADGLIGKRPSGGTKASENMNQIKSHLLTLLDRSKAVVIFATNLFENYDKAFFRRILFHIEFNLPNHEQRVELWKFHLTEKVPKEITYELLSDLSDGLSGGDIKNITIKLCIKLSSKKIECINQQIVSEAIDIYKSAVKASQGGIIN